MKMIRFSYSNKDIKDEEKEEGPMDRVGTKTGCSAKSRACKPRANTRCAYLAISGHDVEPRHNNRASIVRLCRIASFKG
jgi:hypothetical protein